MAVSLSYSFNGTAQEALEREAEEVLALWEEVGSKGLDTWLELPAGYAIEEDSGSELEGEATTTPCWLRTTSPCSRLRKNTTIARPG
jgi:hypothetical protein